MVTVTMLFVGTNFIVPWYHITVGAGKPGDGDDHGDGDGDGDDDNHGDVDGDGDGDGDGIEIYIYVSFEACIIKICLQNFCEYTFA